MLFTKKGPKGPAPKGTKKVVAPVKKAAKKAVKKVQKAVPKASGPRKTLRCALSQGAAPGRCINSTLAT